VSGNIKLSRSAGYPGCLQCPAILCFHDLPDTPALRNVRQYYAFTICRAPWLFAMSGNTKFFMICRALRLSVMSGNIMLSRFAGHRGSPQCPAIPSFYDLPDTLAFRNVRQHQVFTICRIP